MDYVVEILVFGLHIGDTDTQQNISASFIEFLFVKCRLIGILILAVVVREKTCCDIPRHEYDVHQSYKISLP